MFLPGSKLGWPRTLVMSLAGSASNLARESSGGSRPVRIPSSPGINAPRPAGGLLRAAAPPGIPPHRPGADNSGRPPRDPSEELSQCFRKRLGSDRPDAGDGANPHRGNPVRHHMHMLMYAYVDAPAADTHRR